MRKRWPAEAQVERKASKPGRQAARSTAKAAISSRLAVMGAKTARSSAPKLVSPARNRSSAFW